MNKPLPLDTGAVASLGNHSSGIPGKTASPPTLPPPLALLSFTLPHPQRGMFPLSQSGCQAKSLVHLKGSIRLWQEVEFMGLIKSPLEAFVWTLLLPPSHSPFPFQAEATAKGPRTETWTIKFPFSVRALPGGEGGERPD